MCVLLPVSIMQCSRVIRLGLETQTQIHNHGDHWVTLGQDSPKDCWDNEKEGGRVMYAALEERQDKTLRDKFSNLNWKGEKPVGQWHQLNSNEVGWGISHPLKEIFNISLDVESHKHGISVVFRKIRLKIATCDLVNSHTHTHTQQKALLTGTKSSSQYRYWAGFRP